MEEYRSTRCIHRWVLGEPHRGSIKGVCRRCGARRNYPSGLEILEAVPDFEELDASLPMPVLATSSAEEHALA